MLRLRTLGGLSLATDGAPAGGSAQQRKPLALLALLAADGRRGLSRDKLSAFLWPESDAEHARALLKQACYALRRDLHAPELFLGTTELRLNPDVITSDIGELDDALDRGDTVGAVREYAGPFLDGFFAASAEFERWVEDRRATVHRRVCAAVESLAATAAAAGDQRAGVEWGRRLAALDPLSSRVALELLRALVAANDRVAALEFGRAHEQLVRDELGTVPDPAVTDFLARLRAEGQGYAVAPVGWAPSASVSPVTVEGSRPTRARTARARVAIGVAVLVVTGVVVVVGPWGAPNIDPTVVAVVPFDAPDPALARQRDLLAEQLARKLNGLGALRGVVVRRADSAAVPDVGSRAGAGLVLRGRLTSITPDSMRLRLTVWDARADAPVAELDEAAPLGDLDRLGDSLTLGVVRSLDPAITGFPLRALSAGGRSFPALKAYVQGERAWRRFALDTAIASYDRALTFDSTFAMAIRGAGLARGWNLQPGGLEVGERAVRWNRGLDRLDSLLIGGPPPGPAVGPLRLRAGVAQRLADLREAADRYPESPDVWFELGDVIFHTGYAVWWNTWNDARAAFDRAIALDSSYGPAYMHPVEIALNDDDRDAAVRYVNGYLAIPGVNPRGAAMRLLGLLLDAAPGSRRRFARELERAGFKEAYRLLLAIQTWPDTAETQIVVARRVLTLAERATPGGSPAGERELRPYRARLANALVFRGHLREARRVVGYRFVLGAFMDLAQLGAIPPDTVETAIERWLQAPWHPDYQGDNVQDPWLREAPCYRKLGAAWWWVARRDTARLRRLLHQEELSGRNVNPAAVSPYDYPLVPFARLALTLAQGDSVSAVAQYWTLPDSLCPDSRLPPEPLFHILAGAGREREAETVFDWRHDRWVPWVLARAKLAERLGDWPTARKYYGFVAQAWLHADAELRPIVAEAQAGLDRVMAESR
jgi:serine/threonine-protein kinase